MEVTLGTRRAEAPSSVGFFSSSFPVPVSLLSALFCALLHIPCSFVIRSPFLAPTKVLSPSLLAEGTLERFVLQVAFLLNAPFLLFYLSDSGAGYR